jgi:hypothetical protein
MGVGAQFIAPGWGVDAFPQGAMNCAPTLYPRVSMEGTLIRIVKKE